MLLVPALEDLTAVTIAINVYKDYEIQQFLRETRLRLSPGEGWETTMKKKLPIHIYSRPLQQKIMSWIKFIHYEVELWKKHHKTFTGYNFDERIMNTFQWKSDGTIDRMKTASSLIESNLLPLRHRFRLACNYWHDERVLSIWEQMTEEMRNYFCKIPMHDIHESERPFDINVIHWIRNFTEINESNIGEKEWFRLFKFIVKHLQRSLAQKSTAEERLNNITRAIRWNYETFHYSCLFCELPTTADHRLEAQLAVIKYPLPRLLHIILCKRIIPDLEDLDFVELLQEFWSLIPNECKEFVKQYDMYEPITLIVANGRPVLPTLNKYLFHNIFIA